MSTAIRDFALPEARPLPLLLLLDSSGSMAERGKIQALNNAVSDLLATLARETDFRASVHVGVLAFGETVRAHLDFLPAKDALAAWRPLSAAGRTPMGALFRECRSLVENRELIPSRSYRPTLVLVSDGLPSDEWEAPLSELLAAPRGAKATRLAMGIGADADAGMLARFVADPAIPVFQAAQAREITRFFRWVTMSVVARSQSTTPDRVLPPPLDDDDDIRY